MKIIKKVLLGAYALILSAMAQADDGINISDFVINSSLGEPLEAVVQIDYVGSENLRGVIRSAHPYVDFIDYVINKNSKGASVVFTSRVPINEPFSMRLQFDDTVSLVKRDVLVTPFDNRPAGLMIAKSPDYTNGLLVAPIDGLDDPSSVSDINRIDSLQNRIIEDQEKLNSMVKTYQAKQKN